MVGSLISFSLMYFCILGFYYLSDVIMIVCIVLGVYGDRFMYVLRDRKFIILFELLCR